MSDNGKRRSDIRKNDNNRGVLLGKNVVQKIFDAHKYTVNSPGRTDRLKVDQVLTQDATGTMTWLEFEAIGIERIQVETAVTYVDTICSSPTS